MKQIIKSLVLLLVLTMALAGCSGGGGTAAPASPAPLKVFVTSASGNGNLHSWSDAGTNIGVAAGDAVCQAAATAAHLTGTYKAWLSDDTSEAYCHIQGYTGTVAGLCGQATLPVAAGPWVRTDGFPFAETIDKLINNDQVFAPVRYDENGALVSASYFTATNSAGKLAELSPCTNWTISSSDWVDVGSSNGATGNWTGGNELHCSSPLRLLCFQTGTGGPLPSITAPASAKKVFVTSTTHDGNLAGVSGGDAICQALAQTAGLTNYGKFKAWLSDDTHNAKDRLTSPGGPWYRLDGVKVADNLAALINAASAPLFTAISYDETGHYINNNAVWTGTGVNGIKYSSDNCVNWGSNLGTDNGRYGITNLSDYSWTDTYNDEPCDLTHARLYCFEDN